MKTPRLPASFWIGLVLLALGAGACKKEEPETEGLSFIDEVPYYRFTANDRLWLQAKQGDEWKLQNAGGYQRVYRIESVITEIQKAQYRPNGFLGGQGALESYIDRTFVRIKRADSLRAGAQLQFYRGAALLPAPSIGVTDPNVSRFYATGAWNDFVGNSNLSNGGLQFPSGSLLQGPFTPLVVRGRQYNDVLAFIGAPLLPTSQPIPSSYMQELYYDRQVGLVRMVSRAGEVWDRVP